MKKLIIVLGLFLTIGLAAPLSAQNINININLDKQPAWGPTGYDYAEFYYFPDLNVYFDVNHSLFYYLSGSRWISNQYLPSAYSRYDLYNMYKVVVNQDKPWLQNNNHKKSYSNYKGNRTQEVIRQSNNNKYQTSKNNARSWVNSKSSSNNKSDRKSNNQSQRNNKSNNREKTENRGRR